MFIGGSENRVSILHARVISGRRRVRVDGWLSIWNSAKFNMFGWGRYQMNKHEKISSYAGVPFTKKLENILG